MTVGGGVDCEERRVRLRAGCEDGCPLLTGERVWEGAVPPPQKKKSTLHLKIGEFRCKLSAFCTVLKLIM